MWESPPLHFSDCGSLSEGDKVKVCTVGPSVSPNCCIRKPAPLVWVMAPSEPLLRSGWHLLPSPDSGMDRSCYEIRWWEPALCPLFTMSGVGVGAESWGQEQRELGREQRKAIRSRLSPEGLWTFLCLPEVLQCA